MLNRMTLKAVTAAVVVLTAGAAARADFVDTFVVPNPSVAFDLSAGTPTFTRSGDPVAPFLSRQVNAFLLAEGSTSTSGRIGTFNGSGLFSLGTGDGARGYATATYSYSTPTNLAGTGTAFVFVFGQADLNVPFSVTVTSGTGGPTVTQTQSGVATAGSGTYTIPLSGFNLVDLTHVESIELSLNRDAAIGNSSIVTSADFRLTSIALTTPTPPTPVPAPPAAVLGLVALPLLGLYRSRRAVAVV